MSLQFRCAAGCLIPVLVVLVAGCGSGDKTPTGDVDGTVTIAKKPLGNGTVSFYDPRSGRSAGAKIEQGKFKFDKPIAAGTYEVSFLPQSTEAAPDAPGDMKKERTARKAIPTGYQTGHTSGIKAEVKPGANTFAWDLKKTGPRRARRGQTPP